MLLGVLVGVTAPRRRSRCGGCCAPTTSEVRPSTKSMSQPPDPVRPSRLASLASPGPGSSTPHRRSADSCAPRRPTSSPPASRVTRSALSGPLLCSALAELARHRRRLQRTATLQGAGRRADHQHQHQCEHRGDRWRLSHQAARDDPRGRRARLAAARREQRFAAMRLVGATPRQIAVISTVEASIAALWGVAIGFGLFYGIRPALTDVAFTGQRFAPGDLSLGLIDVVVVAIGIPAAAAVSARFAMRRAQISPLGVTRRVTPPAPRAYRLAPLVAGIAELVYFVVVGHPKSTGGQIRAYLSGGFLIIAGLVVAGPWLTMVGARSVARRAQRPAALLAGRRLADNPSGAFRTISGLIIALFAASASVGVLTTILAYGGTANGGTVASETLLEELGHVVSIGVNGHRPPATATTTTKTAVPPALLSELTSIPGVRGATVVYSEPGAGQGSSAGLLLCSQLARTPAIGTCAPGADVGRLSGLNPFPSGQHSTLSGHVWPAVDITPHQLRDLSPRAIVVQTNGSTTALERARTDLEVAFPNQQQTPVTFGEIDTSSRRTITEVQQIANAVIVASLVIAGCSLAVSVTAGISDRKRPLSLLRLAGAPLRVLQRMVVLEAAVPLLVISVFSAGLGFLAAGLFLSSQLGYSLRPPGVDYYLLVLGGIVVSLAVIASTLPLIERIAGPEVARNE